MTIAANTGTSPEAVREEWSWPDIERFLICLPGIRRLEHAALFGGDQ